MVASFFIKIRPQQAAAFEYRNALTLVFVFPPTPLTGAMYGIAVIVVI